jgi:hypothetical protein
MCVATEPKATRLFGSATTFSKESLGECKRQFQQSLELYETNVKTTPTNLQTNLHELKTKAAEASFWDAENEDRNGYVTSDTVYHPPSCVNHSSMQYAYCTVAAHGYC